MPFLTLPIAADGPLIDVLLAVSTSRAKILQQLGRSLPPRVFLRGLLDIGASDTAIDAQALAQLGLMPTGLAPVRTPSTGTQALYLNTFEVSLALLHPDPNAHLILDAIAVLETDLAAQGLGALIGRDVLARCLLIYDGAAGHFTLAY
jgi:hypothetical protein